MSGIEVRTATVRDGAAVAQVFRDCFPDSVERLFPSGAPPWVTERLMEFVIEVEPGGCSVALYEDGEIVGYCISVASMLRLWCRALINRKMWGLFGAVLTGRIRIGLDQLGLIARDKTAFVASFRAFLGGKTGQILSVGVSPLARGRGLGTKLVRAGLCHLRARGATEVKLEVRPDNEAAMRLYQNLGFARVGDTRDSRGAWLVMSMDLVKNEESG